MRSTRRGFNLIELAVASAMAGIISVAAIGAFAHLNRQLVRVQRETSAADTAKSVIDMLVTSLQGVGGGAIRPWMAVWVEDGERPDAARDAIFKPPPAVRTDRITWATLVEDAPTCAITAITGATLTSGITGGFCCIGGFLKGVEGLPAVPTSITAYAINGNHHMQIVMSGLNADTCTVQWQPGPLAILDEPPDDLGALVLGTLSRARIKTLYVDAENNLMTFEQTSFPTIDLGTDEPTLVSSDVFDLQFQLGYDSDGDGRIRDRGANDDEWLHNVVGEGGVFAPADLRMIGVGVIVGVRQPDREETSARVVGGAELTSIHAFLRPAMGRAALRNLFVFH